LAVTDVDHKQAAIGAAEAFHAAADALHRQLCKHRKGRCLGATNRERDLARIMLDAAAPHLAAGVYERIAALAEKVDAFYDAPCPSGVADCVHQDSPFADLIRQEAAGAP
jgi:hypothetical protein